MRPKAKRPDTEAAAARGRSLQIYNTGPLQIGLAFRTRPTAPTQAYTQIGAATKSQNDPIRAERPRERAWRGATSRMAPRNGDSRASEISRAEHGALKSTDPFLARTRVSKTIVGVKLQGRTPPPN